MLISLEQEVPKKKGGKKTAEKKAHVPKVIIPKEYEFLTKNTFDSATATAIYYGFTPIESPQVERQDIDRAKVLKNEKHGDDVDCKDEPLLTHHLEEKVAMIRHYNEKNMIAEPQPVMFAYKECDNKNHKKHSGREGRITLDMIGPSKSGSEAILIRTALSILAEHDITDVVVELNTFGDRQSSQRCTKEIISYYRKHINDMQTHCREIMKSDPLQLLACDNEKCQALKENAPKPMQFLSEPARDHMKEILEFLETLGISYRINDTLVTNEHAYPQTLFRIIPSGAGVDTKPYAVGMRYDWIGKKAGAKKETPIVSVKVAFKRKAGDTGVKVRPPRFSFVTLGMEAKFKSLTIIEELRKAHFFVHQTLNRDKFAGQIGLADRLHLPYILIMGKKEALENTIIVRNTTIRAQDSVPVENLVTHIKGLK